MKKIVYIAIAFGLCSITSCQKNEFEDVMKTSSSEEVLLVTDDKESAKSSKSKSGDVDYTPTASKESELTPWKKEIIQISIKEVSDGDDEADDGDDSKTD